MTETTSVACWNCKQPLHTGAAACLWCGVSQQAPATQFVMAPPGAIGTAPSNVSASTAPGYPSGPATPSRPSVQPASFRPTASRASRIATALPDAFYGAVAGTGARLASFTIDVVAVAVVSVAVAIAASSTVLGALAAIEVSVFLWVLEGRTGLTLGNAAVRLRTSRPDAPYSPGIGRALVKNLVIGTGFVGAVVGAWIIVGSSAWDGARTGRGWANLASRTISVSVPRRQRTVPSLPGVGAPQVIQSMRTASRIEPHVSGLGAARVIPRLGRAAGAIDDSMALSQTGVGIMGTAMAIEQTAPPLTIVAASTPFSPVPTPVMAVPAPFVPAQPAAIGPAPGVIALPPAVADAGTPQLYAAPGAPRVEVSPPVEMSLLVTAPLVAAPVLASSGRDSQSPAAPGVAGHVPEDNASLGTLLLVFDTGQREQLALPTVVNLGRKPAAIEPTDRLISVNDPEGTVSKTHVRLEHSRGRTWVTDQGSTNGTQLLEDDGGVIALEAGQRASVDDGVRVRIGNRAFTISVLIDGPAQGANS